MPAVERPLVSARARSCPRGTGVPQGIRVRKDAGSREPSAPQSAPSPLSGKEEPYRVDQAAGLVQTTRQHVEEGHCVAEEQQNGPTKSLHEQHDGCERPGAGEFQTPPNRPLRMAGGWSTSSVEQALRDLRLLQEEAKELLSSRGADGSGKQDGTEGPWQRQGDSRMKGPSTPRMCESRSPPPSRELAQRKAAVHRQSRKVQAGRPSVGAYGWNEMRLDALRQLRELQAEALELL